MKTHLQFIKKIAFTVLLTSMFAILGCQHEDAQTIDADNADSAAQAAQAATDAAYAAAPIADDAASVTTASSATVSAPVATKAVS